MCREGVKYIADYVKKYVNRPLYRVYILANGLVNISRCKETNYKHGGAIGTIVQGDNFSRLLHC